MQVYNPQSEKKNYTEWEEASSLPPRPGLQQDHKSHERKRSFVLVFRLSVCLSIHPIQDFNSNSNPFTIFFFPFQCDLANESLIIIIIISLSLIHPPFPFPRRAQHIMKEKVN